MNHKMKLPVSFVAHFLCEFLLGFWIFRGFLRIKTTANEFIMIQKARDVLTDPMKRSSYNQFLELKQEKHKKLFLVDQERAKFASELLKREEAEKKKKKAEEEQRKRQSWENWQSWKTTKRERRKVRVNQLLFFVVFLVSNRDCNFQ